MALQCLARAPFASILFLLSGFPSWLLHDPNMIVRESTYKPYLQHIENYFSKLLPILAAFQYSKGNGPVIAFQLENEFGSYHNK